MVSPQIDKRSMTLQLRNEANSEDKLRVETRHKASSTPSSPTIHPAAAHHLRSPSARRWNPALGGPAPRTEAAIYLLSERERRPQNGMAWKFKNGRACEIEYRWTNPCDEALPASPNSTLSIPAHKNSTPRKSQAIGTLRIGGRVPIEPVALGPIATAGPAHGNDESAT